MDKSATEKISSKVEAKLNTIFNGPNCHKVSENTSDVRKLVSTFLVLVGCSFFS